MQKEPTSPKSLMTPGRDAYGQTMTPEDFGRLPFLCEIVRSTAEAQRLDDEIQRLKAEIQDLLEVCRDTLPLNTLLQIEEGHFWADLVIMGSEYASDKDRIEATDRLLSNYFKTPIHPLRWGVLSRPVIREIVEEADTHKISLKEEFHQRKRSSLHVVAEEAVGDLKLRQQKEAIRAVGRALNKELTENILGTDWRQKPKQQELKDEGKEKQTDKLSEVALLRAVELKSLLKSKALNERDVQILSARLKEIPHAELATKLAISPEALRTAYHRAIEKLKKLAS